MRSCRLRRHQRPSAFPLDEHAGAVAEQGTETERRRIDRRRHVAGSQQQQPAGSDRRRQHPQGGAPRCRVHVDQDVAADDRVELLRLEARAPDRMLCSSEADGGADLAGDGAASVGHRRQVGFVFGPDFPAGRHLAGAVLRGHSRRQRLPRDVGAGHGGGQSLFAQHDSQGIGFLPGSAAGRPQRQRHAGGRVVSTAEPPSAPVGGGRGRSRFRGWWRRLSASIPAHRAPLPVARVRCGGRAPHASIRRAPTGPAGFAPIRRQVSSASGGIVTCGTGGIRRPPAGPVPPASPTGWPGRWSPPDRR